MSAARYRLFLLVVSAACTASSAVQLLLTNDRLNLPALWTPQLLALLGASVALSLMLFFLGSSVIGAAMLLVLRAFGLVMIGIPEGSSIAAMALLCSGFIVEVLFYLPVPHNRIVAVLSVLGSLLVARPLGGWGMSLPRPPAADLIVFSASLCLVGVLAELCGRWAARDADREDRIRQLDEAIGRLASANRSFQQYTETAQEKSATEERERITREIHDTVGYTLINIMMMMEEASLLADGNPSLKRLHDLAREQAQTGLNETRRALRLLRAVQRPQGATLEEIKALVGNFQAATGVEVKVEYGNVPLPLRAEAGDFLIRMLQEGMANALRHGKATRIRVILWIGDSELIVNVSDNGTGSAAIKEGIGLSGMRERIAALGGLFEAGNTADGFQVSARIPYPGAEGTG